MAAVVKIVQGLRNQIMTNYLYLIKKTYPNLLPYCFGDHRNSSGSSDTQSAKHKSTIRAKIVETTLTAVLSNPQQTMLFVCPLGETSPSAMIILIEWL